MGRRRWYVLGATVVALTLVAAGCGGGGVDEAGSSPTTVAPSTSTVPASTTTVLTDEQAVLAAVDGYWRAYFAANDPPNPDHPDLAVFSDGEALRISRENATRRRLLGQAVRLNDSAAFRRTTTVESVVGNDAEVTECVVDGSELVDVPSGAVLNDVVTTVRFAFTLRLSEGQWKIVDAVVLSSGEPPVSCG